MSTDHDAEGILFVISAPSGTGKSTLARRLLDEVPNLGFSVSFTTRPPREGERDGEAYHFVDRDRFEAMAQAKEFLEWARVFDQMYGTGLAVTRETLKQGRDLLLDIDVQGARQVREAMRRFDRSPLSSVSVMVLPPDYETLASRLYDRASEEDEQRTHRLSRAPEEARQYVDFDFMVVNNDLEETVRDLVSIVRSERRRTARCTRQADKILATFPA